MQLNGIKLLCEKKPRPGNKDLDLIVLELMILEENFQWWFWETIFNNLDIQKKIENWWEARRQVSLKLSEEKEAESFESC